MFRYRLWQIFLTQFLIALALVCAQGHNHGLTWIAWTSVLMSIALPFRGDVPHAIIFIGAGYGAIALTYASYLLHRDYEPAAELVIILTVVLPNVALPWLAILAALRSSAWGLLVIPLWLISAVILGCLVLGQWLFYSYGYP